MITKLLNIPPFATNVIFLTELKTEKHLTNFDQNEFWLHPFYLLYNKPQNLIDKTSLSVHPKGFSDPINFEIF